MSSTSQQHSSIALGLKNNLQKIFRAFFILLIRFYQSSFSLFFGGNCRFYPSCSNYAYEAFCRMSPVVALKMTLKRLSRCHPLSKKSGYDPVQEEK